MNATDYATDIPLTTAQAAYNGVSFHPERRAESARNDYAAQLAADWAALFALAEREKTTALLAAEFERYRQGYRRRTLAYLLSSSRCVSWFIAGPSNFPAARMNKRADIAHKRLNELTDFRQRAMRAMRRTLSPSLQPIRADDADAVERLERDIAHAEALQARMKQANAVIRQYRKEGEQAQVAALIVLGFREIITRKLLQPDFAGRIGFADYQLTNNGANIRRMKARAEGIARAQATPATEHEGTNARLEDCPADNRVRLFFPGKPDEPIRTALKRAGFRWTPSLGCWQAYRNGGSLGYAAAFAGLQNTP